jgi:hypothetical protein
VVGPQWFDVCPKAGNIYLGTGALFGGIDRSKFVPIYSESQILPCLCSECDFGFAFAQARRSPSVLMYLKNFSGPLAPLHRTLLTISYEMSLGKKFTGGLRTVFALSRTDATPSLSSLRTPWRAGALAVGLFSGASVSLTPIYLLLCFFNFLHFPIGFLCSCASIENLSLNREHKRVVIRGTLSHVVWYEQDCISGMRSGI